jgi:hypothetical protein
VSQTISDVLRKSWAVRTLGFWLRVLFERWIGCFLFVPLPYLNAGRSLAMSRCPAKMNPTMCSNEIRSGIILGEGKKPLR